MIFISHSSRNNDKANQLRAWLIAQGWGPAQIYLDLNDLNAGERWRQALNESGANCEAVIVCLSDDWLRSDECKREFNIAETLHKPIFPLYVEAVTLPIPRFITDLQIASIADGDAQAHGLEQLRLGLLKHGIGPRHFPWPPPDDPDRSVFRGLQTYEESDAAIFFGRDASIGKALDELRRLRDGANERALVILAASGAGKSSFLRAGLLARLRREDHEFIILPTMRPELAALSGRLGLANSLGQALGRSVDLRQKPLGDAFADLRAKALERLNSLPPADLDRIRAKPPTIVLPIDQAEELYQAGNEEAPRFMELLAAALANDGNAVAVFTIRSNAFELLQRDQRFDKVTLAPFNLPPIASGLLGEVVEGPARLAKPPIEIAPELTQHLLTEVNSPDALPWLSFALQRLAIETGARNRKLTLDQYRTRVGGLNKVISSVADDAISPLTREQKDQLPWLLRQLVGLQGGSHEVGVTLLRMTRDPEVLAKRPGSSALIDALIAARILIEDREPSSQISSIRLAHEAVLRGWDKARTVVEDFQDYFKQRDALLRQFESWKAGDGNLLRDAPLFNAEKLIGQYREEIPSAVIDYVAQSRRAADRGRHIAYAVAATMAVLFIVAAAGAFYAARQRDLAENSYRLALDQAAGSLDKMLDAYTDGTVPSGLLKELVARSQATISGLRYDDVDIAEAQAQLLGVMSQANADLGDAQPAREQAKQSLDLAESLAKRAPQERRWRVLVGRAHGRLSAVLFGTGDSAGSADEARKALESLRELVEANMQDRSLQRIYMRNFGRLGEALRNLGKLDETAKAQGDWVRHAQRLAERDPGDPYWQWQVAYAHEELGDTLMQSGRLKEAAEAYQTAVSISAKLLAQDKHNKEHLGLEAGTRLRQGDILLERGDLKGALIEYQASRSAAFQLSQREPSVPIYQQGVGVAHQRMGDLYLRDGNPQKALAEFQIYLDLMEKTQEARPYSGGAAFDVANARQKMGDALREGGEPDKAMAEYVQALALTRELDERPRKNERWRKSLALNHQRIGLTHELKNDPAGALVAYQLCYAVPVNRNTWSPRERSPADVTEDCRQRIVKLGGTLRR